jgi:thiosulfate dehydrogenase
MSRIIFGFILGILLVPIAGLVYFELGNVPVAVSDQPFPYERQITGTALHARIDREMVQMPPIQPDEQNLIAGARIYSEKCAFCHGVHGQKSATGDNMFPDAPQLWEAHHDGKVVGVSDDPPGETYWKVYNGIRLTGMPSYKTLLTQTEMWQVTLLLANADKPLPPAALQNLRAESALAPAAPATPAAKK